MSRAGGMGARWRGWGMATTFYCGSFVDRKPKNCSQKSATSFQAARRVENRHAGTGEVITASAQGWFVCYPRRHLWHL